MIWRLAPYLVAVALVVGLWWHGYGVGRDAERLDQASRVEALEARLSDVSAANRAAAAQLLAARETRAALSEVIENEARQDPDACRIPADGSLRRLERRWQGAAP